MWKELKSPLSNTLSSSFMCGVVDTSTVALDSELSGGLDPPVSFNISFENFLPIEFGGDLHMRVTLERV